MIGGAHAIIFCTDAEKARKFFRDVLAFDNVDAGDGWLIFKLPPAELAIHAGSVESGQESRHELYLMCHDLDRTIAELKSKRVEFVGDISKQRWGRLARFKVPGAGELGLYEPAHPSPLREFQ